MVVGQVRQTILQRKLLVPGAKVLVALSGGPDSAAMLAALHALRSELRLDLHGVSVNHGLRAGAADDVQLAADQAAQLGVPFVGLSLQLGGGPGVQSRARGARYAAMLGHLEEVGANALAVGHTLDDQAETVLMRQLRGAGLRGLVGIRARREDGVVRPLIDCPRAEVHAFARRRFAGLAADPSNQDSRFERVRVRQVVLPSLEVEDPSIVRHLAQLADEAAVLDDFLAQLAGEALEGCLDAQQAIDIDRLATVPHALRIPVLRQWLVHRTATQPTRAHLQQALLCMRGRGEVWLGRGFQLIAVQGSRLVVRQVTRR